MSMDLLMFCCAVLHVISSLLPLERGAWWHRLPQAVTGLAVAGLAFAQTLWLLGLTYIVLTGLWLERWWNDPASGGHRRTWWGTVRQRHPHTCGTTNTKEHE